MGVDVLAVLLTFAIPIVAIIGWVFLEALKLLKGATGKSGKRMNSEETRQMQEIYQGLTKLEDRIESLETLLLDRARMEKGSWERD